jgi:aspartyl-tRNA(Asn)/glutamyl-tRNA(Gln) amidotransferase subunit C
MAQRITEDEVRHAARLARLELSDDDVNRFTRQLADVLDYMAQIKSLDVENVEPMAHPLDMPNVLRDDHPAAPLSREAALKNAPASDGTFFQVPKVLD